MSFSGEFAIPSFLSAGAMAIMAMTSLIIGALIGVYVKPSQRANAVIMAFGTGALIQALALELAYEGAERLIHSAHLSGIVSWLWVAGGFMAGGTVYYVVNQILEQRGAALRHPALSRLYMLNKKRQESAGILEKLVKIELVRSLPPEEMEDVLMCVQPVEVQPGSAIFKQGENGDALYFIDSGRVDIVSGNSGVEGKNLAQLGTGQSFGEMALLTGEPRSASAVAAEPTTLLRIDKVHFDELIDRSPNLRSSVQELISVRLLQNVQTAKSSVDAGHWQKVAVANIQRLSRSEEVSMMKEHAKSGAPFAIFLGAMLDGIPESIVIGSSFVSLESFKFTFFAAVFLSNLPEAVASATAMRSAGFSTMKILGLWGSLMVTGGVAGVLGNIFLTTAPPTILTLVGAVAGGGILAMVSSVMMPEAYEDGGPSVGLATIAGFLCAFLFSLL